MQINLVFDLESDKNILWRSKDMHAETSDAKTSTLVTPEGRIIIKDFTLWLKRINFNGIGLQKATKEFFKTYTWIYQTEIVQRSHLQTQHRGQWQIMSTFKPRHVFIWLSNANRDDNQEENRLIFDLLGFVSCQIFVGNGDSYPECRFEMANKDRIYRQVVE